MKQATAKTTTAAEFAIPVSLRALDEVAEPINAHIRRVNTGFLLVASRVSFKAERRVELMFFDRRIETQVVYCLPQDSGLFHLGLRMTHGNHEALRAEPRIPVDLPGKLHLPGTQDPLTIRVINISASGFGLSSDTEVAAGDIAYVELEIGCAFGEIRHCSRDGNAYRIGLQLDEFISRENEILAARRRENPGAGPFRFTKLFGKSD